MYVLVLLLTSASNGFLDGGTCITSHSHFDFKVPWLCPCHIHDKNGGIREVQDSTVH